MDDESNEMKNHRKQARYMVIFNFKTKNSTKVFLENIVNEGN